MAVCQLTHGRHVSVGHRVHIFYRSVVIGSAVWRNCPVILLGLEFRFSQPHSDICFFTSWKNWVLHLRGPKGYGYKINLQIQSHNCANFHFSFTYDFCWLAPHRASCFWQCSAARLWRYCVWNYFELISILKKTSTTLLQSHGSSVVIL